MGSSIAASAETLRIGKPEATAFTMSFLELGVEQGFFRKHGLEIETLVFAGAPKMHQAMAAKELDIALGTGPDFGVLMRGAPELAVGAMATAPMNFALLVRPDGSVPNPAALRGRSIGVSGTGSMTYWLATEFVRRQGWKPEEVNLVGLGAADGMIAGLMSKNVDAIVSATEAGYRLAAANRAKILIRFGDVIPDFVTHVIFASTELIKSNPDAVRRFLAGWYETIAFAQSHAAETIAVSRRLGNLPEDIAARVYKEQMPIMLSDGHFDRKSLETVFRAVHEMIHDPNVAPKAEEKLYTEQFLPSSEAARGPR
jgi:NitT/TauT family transport system substrate-binding protein